MNSSTSIIGASPPPPGVTPNFVNPDTIAYRIILIAALCPAIAIPIWLLRLYTARFIVCRLHLDDCKTSRIGDRELLNGS